MATVTVSAGTTRSLPGVMLPAGVEQTFPDPASGTVVQTDATVRTLDLNVTLSVADATNPLTHLLFHVDRSRDGGATWDTDYSLNDYVGGPQNTRNGVTNMPGMNIGINGQVAAWRIRVMSDTLLTSTGAALKGNA